MITLISDHNQQAKDRLREQYKGKAKIEAIIDAIVNDIQNLEQAFVDLSTKRNLTQAEGRQLDLLGELLDIPRQGQTDTAYRVSLRAKIAKNFSRGTPEDVISIFKLLSGSTKVVLGDGAKGDYLLLADHPLTQDEVNQLIRDMSFVDSAGVRFGTTGSFNPVESFLLNGQDSGKGLGSIYDVTKGGKLATISRRTDIKFALAGVDSGGGGLGSIYDPLLGGTLRGV